METTNLLNVEQTMVRIKKEAYKSPILVTYGRVAALTKSASGCSQADNPTCAVGQNMGPPMA
jgi:hypothetical protein